MISTRFQDNTVRIICSGKQTIQLNDLKRIYRNGLRVKNGKENISVIVQVSKNVKLSKEAQELFDRVESKENENTLVIISGQVGV